MLYQGQLQEYTANLVNSLTNLVKSTGAGAKVFALLARSPRKRPHLGFHPRSHGPSQGGSNGGNGSGNGNGRSSRKAPSRPRQRQSPLLAAAAVGGPKDEWSVLDEAYDEEDDRGHDCDANSDNDSHSDDSSSSDEDDSGNDSGNVGNNSLVGYGDTGSSSSLPSGGTSIDNSNNNDFSGAGPPTLPRSLPPVVQNAAAGAMPVSLSNVWFAYPSRPREPVLKGLTISAEPSRPREPVLKGKRLL